MPVGTLTFTGPIGPGRSLTSKVFNNVAIVAWKLAEEVLEIVQTSDNPQGNTVTELDIAPVTTVVHTVTATVHSITVS
jgi:hypothetical protein